MSLEWILGRCDSLRAEVFLRATLPEGMDPADVMLTGTLTGPECRRAITLPVTAKFLQVRNAGHGATAHSIVARAILTEPSYWTPEMPNLYRLDARLVAGGREMAAWTRAVGLRRFGVRGRSLWLDGRRYVPRGLVMPEAAIDVQQFREAAIAAVVADPLGAFLDRCDAEGVAVIGLLADAHGLPLDATAAADRISEWTWHSAVLMAVVPAAAADEVVTRIAAATHGSRGTLLLAQEVDGSATPPDLVDRAEALVVSLAANALPNLAWRIAPPNLPLLAQRVDELPPAAAPNRRPCDTLQAALAAWAADASQDSACWDWAGYLIHGDKPS